ncbi:hypothetical protein CRG98_035898 [Punica granatum]|uniref:Uncharacterized protein n=1 Tax=Punica granatum TaxID=22663 RepID=A0A2I0II62_PUNGR|nr:hypothetical protein CRG98_035898 [Punica granatum]
MGTASHACPSLVLGNVDNPKQRDSVARMRASTIAHSGKCVKGLPSLGLVAGSVFAPFGPT